MPSLRQFRKALWILPTLGLLAAGLRDAAKAMHLSSFPPLTPERLPGLSIVVAARNEAESLAGALSSLLEQDYPTLEVILVDDRSTDGTSEIADRVQREHPRGDRLTVIHNHELPAGWLGKVHALHLGVKATSQPLVLLTDADIRFSPDALKRAVTALEVLQGDHLAVAPRFDASGFWEPVLVAYFFVLFIARYQPSSVHRSKKRFAGVGAFNLVRRSLLETMEWLEPLRLQVIDDMHLGLMAKARGARQFALLGQKELSVRWFRGLSGVIKGLEKNAYAGLSYSPLMAVGASVFAAAPLWSILLVGWQAGLWWALVWYLLQVALGAVASRAGGVTPWAGLGFPLAGPVLAYAMLRSAYLAERRRAIIWRDTRYALGELRLAHHQFLEQEKL